MWVSFNDEEFKRVLDALRSTKGDRPADEADIALAKRLEEQAEPGADDQAFIDAATDPFGEDYEIDADVVVSRSDDGAYVMAWVWVSNEDADIEDTSTDEDDDEADGEGEDA